MATLLSFLLAILFSRTLPPEIFGKYTYAQSLFFIVSFFGLSGMGVAITRAAAKKRFSILPSAIVATFMSSLLGSLALLLLSGFFPGADFLSLLFLALLFPLYYSTAHYAAFLQGLGQFRLSSILSLLPNFLSFTSLALGLYLGIHSIVLLLVLTFLPIAVVQAVLTFFLLRRHRLVFNGWPFSSPDVGYGLRLSLIDILPSVSLYSDKVLIGILLPPRDLAIYSFAIAIPEIIKGYMKNITLVAIPKLADQRLIDYRKAMKRHFSFLFMTSVVLVGAYVLLSPFLFELFFPAYRESVFYSQLFAFTLFLIPTFLFTSSFQAYKNTSALARMNVLYFVIQTLALVILIPKYGLVGAILGRALSRLAAGVYSGFLFFSST